MAEQKKKVETKKVGRMMPYNLEAEIAVLGSILIDSSVADDLIPSLKEEDFYSNQHRIIFKAMTDLYHVGTPVDLVSLSDRLNVTNQLDEVGSMTYISSLTDSVLSAANGKHYMEMIKRDALTRNVITTCNDILEYAYDCEQGEDALQEAEKQIYKISESDQRSDLQQIEKAMMDTVGVIEQTQKGQIDTKVVFTGFKTLDTVTHGLKPGEMILIAARPSVGKTAFALNIAVNVALNSKKNVAVFSLEMDANLLAKRMLAYASGISLSKMSSIGGMTNEDNKKMFRTAKQLSAANIYVDDYSMNTPQDILSKGRKLVRQKGCDLIIIDYLQLMNAKNGGKSPESRQNEVAEMSRAMKVYAKELGCPIIVLSQLSRGIESRTNHEPQLSDLRESGAIEQDADVVMFLAAPHKYNSAEPEDKVELYVKKNRNGQCIDIELKWDGSTTSFKEVGVLNKEDSAAANVEAQKSNDLNSDNVVEKLQNYTDEAIEVLDDDFTFDDEDPNEEEPISGDLDY